MITVLSYLGFLFGSLLAKNRSTIFLFLFGFFIWLIASIRDGQGPDYFAYQALFNEFDNSIIEEYNKDSLLKQELLFRLFGSFLKGVGLDYQGYLAVIAMISIIFVLFLCKEYSKYPSLSFLIFFSVFFFVWPYSGIRQGLVICIGSYYLYECGRKSNFIKYIFVVCILSQIHLSALFLIIFFVIYRIGHKWKIIIFAGIISIFLAIMSLQIIDLLSDLLPFGSRISFYQYDQNSSSYLDQKTIFRFIIFLISIKIYIDFLKIKDEANAALAAVLVSSFFVYIIFKTSEILAAQLSIYGFFAMTTVLPNYVDCRSRLSKSIKIILLIAYSFIFFNKTYFDMVEMSDKNSENINLIR